MEQFILEKYLENPSRKVVTREGRPVRIVCWDLKCNTPIIAAIQWNQEREDCYCYNTIGRCANDVAEIDLFFADEEEELTEFEKELQTIISEASHWTSDDGSISTYCQFGDKEIKKISAQILDLAKRELQPEIDKEIDKAYKNIDTIVYDNGYKQGQYEIMEDLPKWKKDSNNLSSLIYTLDNRGDGRIFLCRKGYAININELLNLPKEK